MEIAVYEVGGAIINGGFSVQVGDISVAVFQKSEDAIDWARWKFDLKPEDLL